MSSLGPPLVYHEGVKITSSDNDNRIPLVITYHPGNIPIRKIIVKSFELLRKHESTKHIFSDPPITAYRRERNIRDRIVRALILHLHLALPNANVTDAKHVVLFGQKKKTIHEKNKIKSLTILFMFPFIDINVFRIVLKCTPNGTTYIQSFFFFFCF